MPGHNRDIENIFKLLSENNEAKNDLHSSKLWDINSTIDLLYMNHLVKFSNIVAKSNFSLIYM